MAKKLALKQHEKELQILKEEIERKTGKTTEQLYTEREKRISDAVALIEPDTVPLSIDLNISLYAGIQNSAAYYDPVGWKKAIRRITLDFEPDMCNAGVPTSGRALEALGVQNRLWPGGPLPPDYEYQFVERELMKEDEYDHFLSDPSDFLIRCYLPRLYGALQPFSLLPPLGALFQGFEGLTPMFASPEFIKLANSLLNAGRETIKFKKVLGDIYEELSWLGFPAFTGFGGVGGAPYDTISSFLRGMTGAMIDMYRRPEKLIRACDMILEKRIAEALPADSRNKGNSRRIGIPLWRGDKVFMSEKQFQKFYWPGLKKTLQADIDLGYVPIPLFEAEFGDRLEHLLELPKGKMIAGVNYLDAVRAKEILGNHTCIMVFGPLSLKLASIHETEEYIKNMIDRCGKGGGLILNVRLPDKGTTGEFKAMLDRIREYGRYN